MHLIKMQKRIVPFTLKCKTPTHSKSCLITCICYFSENKRGMAGHFIEYIFLVLIILGFVMIANRLRIGYPIVLVIGGLLLSFTSTFSQVTIDPELVFFMFLPPLLYEAAWSTSWKEFWKWRRVITSFAFPIVIFTSCVIAFVSSKLIPGFTLALGF